MSRCESRANLVSDFKEVVSDCLDEIVCPSCIVCESPTFTYFNFPDPITGDDVKIRQELPWTTLIDECVSVENKSCNPMKVCARPNPRVSFWHDPNPGFMTTMVSYINFGGPSATSDTPGSQLSWFLQSPQSGNELPSGQVVDFASQSVAAEFCRIIEPESSIDICVSLQIFIDPQSNQDDFSSLNLGIFQSIDLNINGYTGVVC